MSHRLIDHHDVSVDFLRTEIQTGMTFAGLATDAGNDAEKRDRNRDNANKAAVAVERFLPQVRGITPAEAREIGDALDVLKRAIAAIPA